MLRATSPEGRSCLDQMCSSADRQGRVWTQVSWPGACRAVSPQVGQRFLAHGRKAILPGAPGLLHCLAKGATRIYMFPCISKAMEGIMQVAKWGNSLAVRLPAQLVQEMGLKAGDEIQITRAEPGLAVSRLPSPEEVLADLRRFRGRLPASQRLSRDDANAR